MLEAFDASQRAVQSAAGDAMARSAALTAATSAAVGPQAQAYEAALLERDALDKQYAKAIGTGGAAGVEKREALARARAEAVAKIERLASELKTKAPLYWDYRSPEPVTVAALQDSAAAHAVLLHDDEALIVFLVAPAKGLGLVFAVTKSEVAWTRLGLTGHELKERESKLRSQIDPEGYVLPGDGGGAYADDDTGVIATPPQSCCLAAVFDFILSHPPKKCRRRMSRSRQAGSRFRCKGDTCRSSLYG